MDLRSLIDQLIHRQSDKVTEHDVHYRTHAGHRGAHTDARYACFRNWRVDDPLSAELFYQSREHFKRRTRLSDIFADDKNSWIAAHLFGKSFIDGLPESDFADRRRL